MKKVYFLSIILCTALLLVLLPTAAEAVVTSEGIFEYTGPNGSLLNMIETDLQGAPFNQSPGAYDYSGVTSLKISGEMKDNDYAFIKGSLDHLETLDISGVSGSFPIPDSAFYRCSSIKTVRLPAGISMPKNMFYECSNLKSLVIGSGVLEDAVIDLSGAATSFKKGVFRKCSSIEAVRLPPGASISDEMFSDCSSLSTVLFTGSTAPLISPNAFTDSPAIAYVPDKDSGGYDAPAFTSHFIEVRSITLPRFLTQPSNQTKTVGEAVYFSVTVEAGEPAPYALQWQLSADIGGSWNDIAAATGDRYDIASVDMAQNGYQYRCVAASLAGSTNSSAATLTVLPSGGGSGSSATYYTITVSAGAGGKISPSGKVSVREGYNQTFSITPEEGYKVKEVRADGQSLGALTSYTFENVRQAHTITASFEVIKPPVPPKSEDMGINPPLLDNPFADISEKDWFYDEVLYVYGKKIMLGVSPRLFAPDAPLNRGMFVTLLYRISGETGLYENPFSDIPAGIWYEKAAAWATAKGICQGIGDGLFAPEQGITREQLAVMLYNYAKYKGYNVSEGEDTNILSYNDALTISEYAFAALQWSCAAGLLQGDDQGNLNPDGFATRAEAAAILQRFLG